MSRKGRRKSYRRRRGPMGLHAEYPPGPPGEEDLWVYQAALLRTIAATNGTQTYFHKMPIKRIDALSIAQAAAVSFVSAEGRISACPAAAGPGHAQTGAQVAAEKRPPSGGQKLSSGGSGGPPSSADASLTDYRYVNQLGTPLRGDEKPPFEEYNMTPIHMRLWMNQRKIVNLIVNLANSRYMPIEVRRVSIRPGEQGSAIDFSRFLPSKEPGGSMGRSSGRPGMSGTPSSGFMPGGEGPRYGVGGGSRQEGAWADTPTATSLTLMRGTPWTCPWRSTELSTSSTSQEGETRDRNRGDRGCRRYGPRRGQDSCVARPTTAVPTWSPCGSGRKAHRAGGASGAVRHRPCRLRRRQRQEPRVCHPRLGFRALCRRCQQLLPLPPGEGRDSGRGVGWTLARRPPMPSQA